MMEKSLNARISMFLAKYHSTPHATTGISPNELFLQRKVRTKLDMLKPDVQSIVHAKQSLQKKYHDNQAKLRVFLSGQAVMARDYLSAKKWIPGVIESSSGPTMYRIKLNNGKVVVRHVDQLLSANPSSDQIQTDDRFKFFNDEATPLPTPPDVQRQDDVPASRYHLRSSHERRPVERLVNFHI